ncbi:transposase [Algoriphagus iocasae]|uniref:transposase n=1 Tax=Algoriphagus iocasae TaxID=1836499 RepID=UPI00293BFA99|nr:transposase [Algoriphagus iocasae]
MGRKAGQVNPLILRNCGGLGVVCNYTFLSIRICNSLDSIYFHSMGDAYQIKDQELPHFLTFQVVGWADVFSRKVYRDFILDNLTYSRNERGLYLYGYVIMSNHIHLVVQQKDGKLSEWVRDFKKFTSKKLLKLILENPQESRREWLKMILNIMRNSTRERLTYSFGRMIIMRSNSIVQR